MGDQNRIPCRGRGPRQEPLALVLGKVRLVGNENAGIGIESEKLARSLRQTMAGNDQHGLSDQPEAALFHDGGGHGHGLAGADGMGKIGGAARDDAPDATLLVRIEGERRAGAWKLQMVAIEGARRDIVEAVVVDPRQPVSPIWVSPDPFLEGSLDFLELFLGRLGIDDVEHPPFRVAVPDSVENLRHPAVERIVKKFPGMAPLGAPFRHAGG